MQRDEVDQRAGDDHADEAQCQRQRRGGERAEDDEQDQRDDREAARLGLGQVFLGELLHAGPDRRLTGEVGRHPALGGAGVEFRAQGRRRVDQQVGGLVAAQRQHRLPGAPQLRLGPLGDRRGQRHPVETGDRLANPIDRGDLLAGASNPGSALSSTTMPSALDGEAPFQRVADRLRLAARDVEAAAGEVFGLTRGEWQSEEREQGPNRRAPSDVGVPGIPPVCSSTHALAGQPASRSRPQKSVRTITRRRAGSALRRRRRQGRR